jgi:hypothetical protein
MEKQTLAERIEASGEYFKEILKEKAVALLTIEGPNAITLDGLESLWGEANKEAAQLTEEFFNDTVNKDLQEELLRKKKTELKNAGFEVRNGGNRAGTILTINGEARMGKTVLRTSIKDETTGLPSKKEVVVLDDYFNLRQMAHRITTALKQKICFWSQNQGSYESAQEIMRNEIGINVSDEFMRTITMEAGQLIVDDDTEKAEDIDHINAEIPQTWTIDGTLYIMIDGSMIRTRDINDDGTAAWKEVKLGMVFTDEDLVLKADGEKHYIKEKDYAVSCDNVEEFSKLLYECAVSYGYGKYRKVVIVSDGATWIRNMCKDIFPEAMQILDFYHLSEHVYEAGKELFHDDAKKYKPWAVNIISLLRNSETSRVFEILSNDKEDGNCIEKLCNYITNNCEKIDYAAYRKAGLLIGSGPIESANKVVVQKRCKQSGMRWNLPNARRMISIRAKVESGNWPQLAKRLLKAA